MDPGEATSYDGVYASEVWISSDTMDLRVDKLHKVRNSSDVWVGDNMSRVIMVNPTTQQQQSGVLVLLGYRSSSGSSNSNSDVRASKYLAGPTTLQQQWQWGRASNGPSDRQTGVQMDARMSATVTVILHTQQWRYLLSAAGKILERLGRKAHLGVPAVMERVYSFNCCKEPQHMTGDRNNSDLGLQEQVDDDGLPKNELLEESLTMETDGNGLSKDCLTMDNDGNGLPQEGLTVESFIGSDCCYHDERVDINVQP